ncbi:immunoglobulin-like and fibronectin type III domain-containing protein 1 [Pempheris klunzingeri]|uniref:immunoglobulin-like and fibronectin type III domain-containing protein 1 n=1 Tax=Pempheris klunzingeri TaxID=3127111 RepID=UPI00397EC64D
MAPKAFVPIKKRSRVPGVMITQYVEQLPMGQSTPDFTRKPMAATVQEGKKAFFKAMVNGEPAPTVTWGRNKGEVDDPEKYKTRYDERAQEHILEIFGVTPDQADTYKCFATNEHGQAVCTANLKVMEVGFKKKAPAANGQAPQDFRSMLKKTVVVTRKKQLPPKKEGEIDPKLWELLISAPKRDYEKICLDFGVTDFRWLLKRLNQMKKERADEQAKVVEKLENVKQIEVTPNGRAEFSVDMNLWDPNSAINLYKDGTMVPYGDDENAKHSLKKTGTKYVFSIKDPQPEDAGFYQLDVEEANVLSTDFQVPAVEFIAKIKDAEVVESEDAIFQCVLSTPLNRITWAKQDLSLEHGDKYEITVSEDKLIHKLIVKDCEMADKGAYYAIAGITSSRASLTVEADPNGRKGRKSTQTGDQDDLTKLALEQQAKLQKEKDDLDAARRQQAEKDAADAAAKAALGDGGDGRDGSGDRSGDGFRDKTDGEEGDGDGKNKNLLTEGDDENKKDDADDKKKKRSRTGPLVPDTVTDRGVQFVSGLSDMVANIGERAELSCKLSNETSEGRWYKNGKLLTNEDGVTIIKDGACHRLVIDCCKKDDAAVYRFEAEGRKSEATLNIQDPPRIDAEALGKFTKPVIVKAGENAEWKLPFSGGAPMNIHWYKDDDELLPALNVKIETSDTEGKLRLNKCQRKDSGEVKIKIKNEFGTIEAISKLIVLDKPTPPQGPVDIMESAVTSVEFKWKPPKDSGGCPVTNYIVERQQVGRNKWSNLSEIPGSNPSYKDSDVDPGRRYCYRIRAKNAEGVSDYLMTEDIAAGVLRYPGTPTAPKVVSAFKDCINLAWSPPCDTGGTKIVGYNMEKNKKGTNYWSLVNQGGPITDTKYAVKDVFEGAAYEFRVSAINLSGAGDPSIPCDTVIARDPMKPPGKVTDLKLTSSNYTTISLAWTKPKEIKGVEDEAQGYYVEIRPIESLEWTRCNTIPITLTSYTVLGLKAMATYWVRVTATNYGGDGEPQGFDNYIIAMPPPVRPKFKDRNMKTFVVVRSGNTVRLNINFEASPLPEISWLKDGFPVSKHVTITNSDKGSQLLIPTSERSDTGIYTITVKNIVGQESFNVEIRVTDDPKPPGPVELDQNIPGTVTLFWTPSPDERRDDRLHYMVSKRDSFKRTWRTVADNLFNNKFTVVNILPGREYYFRVFAKNDMGPSPPTESPVFEIKKEKGNFKVNLPETRSLDFQSPPSFIVPLKRRTAPQGYECYMTCAVKGDPAPRVTWYCNNISLNTNTNYHITNVCGVCSMLILKVAPRDNGEYKVVIENKLGTAESSTMLNVRAMTRRKSKKPQTEDTSILLESSAPQCRRGTSSSVSPTWLFIMVVFTVGASVMGWFCVQQQHSLDQLSDSFNTMQQRITELQQVMEMTDAQTDTDTDLRVEEKISALEEAQKQAQEMAEASLATSEKLKNSDVYLKHLDLRDEMDTRLAEIKQVYLSITTLQAMFKNQSEEFEAVKESLVAGLSSSSTLVENVAGLTDAVAAACSRVDEQVASVEALNAQSEGQASELKELKESIHLHSAALHTSNQDMATIKELVEAQQAMRVQALKEMLTSVQMTLNEQFFTSQTLHSSIKAHLQTFHTQLANVPSWTMKQQSNEEARELISTTALNASEVEEKPEDIEKKPVQQDTEDEAEEEAKEEEVMQEEQPLEQEVEGNVTEEQEEREITGEEEEITPQSQEDEEITGQSEEREVAEETAGGHVLDEPLEDDISEEAVESWETVEEETAEFNNEIFMDENKEEE